MSRRTDRPREASGSHGRGASDRQLLAAVDAQVVATPARRPNLSGDLETMLFTTPSFRRRPLGYDRLQVDNYVIWAETELLAARRETDDLMDRYGRCWAELELTRRVVGHSPEGQQLSRLSERIGTMLQLAADEAAEITATAASKAERVRREARADADADRRKAREVAVQAVADADRLRLAADADRAVAAAARQQTEIDVAELAERAGQERMRLDKEAAQTRARLDVEATKTRELLDREAAERRDREALEAAQLIRQQAEAAREEREAAAAAARERLARVEAEIAELERQREVAHASLLRMSDQVSEAVATLAASLPAPGLRLAPPHQAAS